MSVAVTENGTRRGHGSLKDALPSVLLCVGIYFKVAWLLDLKYRAFISHNVMAGSLVSALAVAGTASQILATLRDGVGSLPRLVFTTCFALYLMMLLYAGNGMSESIYIFTLIASTCYFLRWINKGDLRSLAHVGWPSSTWLVTRRRVSPSLPLSLEPQLLASRWIASLASCRSPTRRRRALTIAPCCDGSCNIS